MPFYRFTAESGTTTLEHKAAIAAAVSQVYVEETDAPAQYVHCSFVAVEPGSLFVAGRPVDAPRMVGLIRSGRTAATKARLLHRIADEWSSITGQPREEIAVFLHEVPGANVLEDGQILPEAAGVES